MSPEPVLVEQFGLFWLLDAPLEIWTPNYRVAIPQGIVTDFASIPKLLQPIFSPTDPRYSGPAVGHDWLYASHLLSRADADDFLYEAARLGGTSHARAFAIWCGVRIGGASAYATGPARQASNRKRYETLAAV